ncbi:MAG: hypothetical protein ABJC63_03645 [Gemmatimonadales bacterium]
MNLPTAAAIIVLAVATTIPLSTGSAQTRESSSRAGVIVASFNKSKHAVKERRGARAEEFKEVKFEPVIPRSPSALSGSYEVPGMGASLRLQIDDAGRVTGAGTEPLGDGGSVMRMFTIRARISTAPLSLERRFTEMVRRPGLRASSSPGRRSIVGRTKELPRSDSAWTAPLEAYGVTVKKLFYQRAR